MKSNVIIVNDQPSVNPHRVLDRSRLAHIHDRILSDLIQLHRAELAPEARRQLAGIPPLTDLEQERRRREASRIEVAS